MDHNGKTLIYYKYIYLDHPQEIYKQQKDLCLALGIKGRIIIATEGINATVGGSALAISSYIQLMQRTPLFSDIDYKLSEGSASDFPRLRVVIRDQIVHWGPLINQSNLYEAGVHLDPAQTHALLSVQRDDVVVFDVRNSYESRIGSFKGALKAPIKNFRDLPAYIDNNTALFKDKTVIMYCTSGVRCERASAYLKTKNIAQNVYQMTGGIQRYTQQYPEGYFRGKNYVFDARRTINVNNDILTHCDLCQRVCDDYSDCINAYCNKQFIGCSVCLATYNLSCSPRCSILVASHQVPLRKLSIHAAHTTSNNLQAMHD